jgi:hypothetical protein
MISGSRTIVTQVSAGNAGIRGLALAVKWFVIPPLPEAAPIKFRGLTRACFVARRYVEPSEPKARVSLFDVTFVLSSQFIASVDTIKRPRYREPTKVPFPNTARVGTLVFAWKGCPCCIVYPAISHEY